MADDVEPFTIILRDVNCGEDSYITAELSESQLAEIIYDLLQADDLYVLQERKCRLVPVEDPLAIDRSSIADETYWYGMTPQGRAKWEPWAAEP